MSKVSGWGDQWGDGGADSGINTGASSQAHSVFSGYSGFSTGTEWSNEGSITTQDWQRQQSNFCRTDEDVKKVEHLLMGFTIFCNYIL